MPALALAVAGLADYVLFRRFDHDYVRWYISAGPLIQVLVATFAVAVDLERRPLLISANPGEFVAEALAVAGESYSAFVSDVNPPAARTHGAGVPARSPLDLVFSAAFYATYMATFLAWLVVVAPLQYVGNLVAGAPVRLAVTSPLRRYASRRASHADLVLRHVGDEVPEGEELVGLSARPVAVTASISAALLYALGILV